MFNQVTTKRFWYGPAILVGCLLAAIFLSWQDGRYLYGSWGDVALYHHLANKVWAGQIPFVNFFFEYPPASIVYFLIPRIFGVELDSYRHWFELASIVCAAGTVYFSRQIMELWKPQYTAKVSSLMAISLLILAALFLTRYDTLTMFITIGALYFYLKGIRLESKPPANTYKMLAWVVLVLGGFTKLYPFALLPILAIIEWRTDQKRLLARNIIASLVSSIPFLILMGIGWAGTKWFLEYQGGRGLEIEGLSASILLFTQHLGLTPDVSIVYNYSSFGLSGYWPNILSTLAFPLLFIVNVVIWVGVWRWFSPRNDLRNSFSDLVRPLILAFFLTILGFILTNKVFSTQYILWIVPFQILAVYLLQKNWRILAIGINLLIVVITTLIFPSLWGGLTDNLLPMVLILLLRNVLLCVEFGFGIWYLFKTVPLSKFDLSNS